MDAWLFPFFSFQVIAVTCRAKTSRLAPRVDQLRAGLQKMQSGGQLVYSKRLALTAERGHPN